MARLFPTVLAVWLLLNVNSLSIAQEEEPESNMMRQMLEQLKSDPYVKEHLGWMLVIGQHPMYLLIDEDRGEPPVGERIPPWGAPNKEGYVARVRRNLKSLDKIPQLRLNYQWSAVELQSMCESFPDVYEQMKKAYQKGSLDFVDGTYSQSHLQILTSESNWRQFEYGSEVYKKLFDKKVDVYARQETGLHMQVPQLLRQFGYKFAAMPAFHAAIQIVGGKFEMVAQEGRLESVCGDDFVNWVGLDGSTVPFYLNVSLGWGNLREAYELQQDMYSAPKLFAIFPDMDEVEQDTFDEYYALFDWVLLRDGLLKRYEAAPPRAKAQVYSYWSYQEGVWAEELWRTMRKTESAALLAEQILSMAKLAGLGVDKGDEIKEVWKTILKSQHHDISWLEVTDLKRKSINRLQEAKEKCEKTAAEIAEKLVEKADDSVAVFNGLARSRQCLVWLDGRESLGDEQFQQFGGKSVGFVKVPAGGYKGFSLSGRAAASKKTEMPDIVTTKYYSVRLDKDGLMKQITTRPGNQLLRTDEYLGGEIRARINKKWVDNRTAECTYYTGSVCDIVERSTKLGSIPLSERYYFFKNQPYIKVELEFDFDKNEVGYMWFDQTKINVYYPTGGVNVYQDIPFGYVEARQGRPLFCTNWLYCGGLVYVNRGTVKHWVRNGVIANVIGWGSNHFTNRLHWDWVNSTQYDIRLDRKQKIEYFLIPAGDFDGNKIVQQVQDITSPVLVCPGTGERSYYQVEDKNLSITSIYPKQDQVWVRGYRLPGKDASPYHDWEIFNSPIRNLD